MNYKKDRVISVKGVMLYILKNWQFVFIFLIIGCFGLAGLCYTRDKKNIEKTEMPQKTEADLEKKYEILDEEQKRNVDYALHTYNMYHNALRYFDNSLLMNCDPFHMEYTTIHYMIKLDNVNQYTEQEIKIISNQLVSAYVKYVNSGGLTEAVAEKCEFDAEIIDELFTVGYNYNNESVYDFYITVSATDIMPDMTDYVEEAVEKKIPDIEKSISKHSLNIVGQYREIKSSMSAYWAISDMHLYINNMKTDMETEQGKLSRKELEYYNAVISTSKNTEILAADKQPQTISKRRLLKFGIVGAFLGAVGACVLLLLRYMFSKVIIAKTDYTSTLGLKYLGLINMKEKVGKLEQLEYGNDLIDKYDDAIDFIIAKLKAACDKQGIKKLALISSVFENVPEQIFMDLNNKMTLQGIEFEKLENVFLDCNSMNKLFDIGKCVLIGVAKMSKYDQVCKEVELCEENDIQILGAIDVRI